MKSTTRTFAGLLTLALTAGTLTACNSDNTTPTPVPTATPTPTPTPTATATSAGFDVTPCINQTIPGTGLTVAQAVIPDTIKVNFGATSGFPNGRRLADPVIDVTLAIIFLDLTKHSPATFASLPLNPPANERPFLAAFPYLATPNGTPPVVPKGTTFTFRTDAPSAYTRVDRMGMPAVATALIGSSMKNAYNDANPSDDAAGTFVPEIGAQLTGLTNALADDLVAAKLSPCAKPK